MDDRIIDVSLKEMVDAMKYYSDECTFRWFQASTPSHDGGGANATVTMRLSIGSIRAMLV